MKLPPNTTKAIIAFLDKTSERKTQVTVTPLKNFNETASLLISQFLSTISDQKLVLRVTNTTESPHPIRKKHSNCRVL